MRGKIVLGLFVLTLAVLFAAVQYRKSLDQRAALEKHTRTGTTDTSPKTVNEKTTAAPVVAPDQALPSSVVAVDDPQFQQWIHEEAKSLDDLSVNGERKEAEIREVVRKITPVQARQLRHTITHPQSATREKILSAYLLVEGGLNTREELRKAIVAPFKEKGGEAHSEDEQKGVREKSLRIMMIDGLYAQAQKDPAARETLARAIVDSEDPYIKAYAQERYDQLPKR